MQATKRIGVRQMLAPAAAVALIAGGIAARSSDAPSADNDLFTSVQRGAVAAISSLFDPPKDAKLEGDYSKPLGSNQSAPGVYVTQAPESKNVMVQVIKQTGDDGTYEVVIKNGKINAKVNGKPVPESQVVQDNGNVQVLDADGNVVATFKVGAEGQFGAVYGTPRTYTLDQLFQGDGQGNAYAFATNQVAPKVMIGVTMSDAPRDVLEYFKVDPPVGIVLDRVYEGLPADKAGLKARDIIVSIEGVEEATPDALRSLLADKSPGDTIKVKVFRNGDVSDEAITLAPYDAEKLEVQSSVALDLDQDAIQRFGGLWANKLGSDEAKAAIEQAMKALGQIDEKELSEKVRKSLEEAMKHLESSEMSKKLEHFGGTLELQPRLRFFTDQDGQTFTFPRSGTFEWNQAEDRIAQLDERLSSLEAKLDKLEQAIDKLTSER